MQIYEFSAKPPKKPPNSFYFIVILDTNHENHCAAISD